MNEHKNNRTKTRESKPDMSAAPSGLVHRFNEEMLARRYARKTIKAYSAMLKKYLAWLAPRHPMTVKDKEVRRYVAGLVDRGRSRSYVDQTVSMLKILYVQIYGWNPNTLVVPRPRRDHKLPTVPSREQILRMADALENRRHRLALLMLYSCGLRVSELANMKVGDLDLEQRIARVRQGKGFKDRNTVLSERLLDDLHWVTKDRPGSDPLIRSNQGGALSTRSLQMIVKKAAKKAGLSDRISAHSLRHAFATHLLETGTQMRVIQGLLGHKSIHTTQRYLHMRSPQALNARSPL